MNAIAYQENQYSYSFSNFLHSFFILRIENNHMPLVKHAFLKL